MQCLTQHTRVTERNSPSSFVVGVVLVGVSVVDGSRETPGPFPNPEAKPGCADGTAPGRVWESRLPPTLKT